MIEKNKRISKIICTKCKSKKGVRPDVLTARVLKYGSLETLLESYVCAKCRKALNINAIGKEKLVNHKKEVVNAFWRQPGYKIEYSPRPMTQEDFERITLLSCLRPDKCLDGVCCTCKHFGYCKQTDPKGNLRKKINQLKLDKNGVPIKKSKRAKIVPIEIGDLVIDDPEEVIETVSKKSASFKKKSTAKLTKKVKKSASEKKKATAKLTKTKKKKKSKKGLTKVKKSI